MAKKKPITQREKALRAQVKKDLQTKGMLPPNKPRLNRKKFVNEAWEEYGQLLETDYIRSEHCLRKAIGCMIGPGMHEVTPEEVGVAKLLKIAVATSHFMDKLKAEGREQYTIGEYIDEVVLPITKL